MQALTFKEDRANFYIGNLLSKIGDWTIFQAVDDNGFVGSIHFFRNDFINSKNNLLQEEKFYNYLEASNQIIDPFNFNKENFKITKIKWNSLPDLLTQIQSFNPMISIESIGNKTYTGRINMVTVNSVYLDEQTEDYNLTEFPLKIDYNKIVGIAANSIENKLFNNWLLMENPPINQELVELHFDYHDDSRFNTYYLGKIIKEDKNHLLFESLNNLGQLDGVLLINKSHLIHTVHQSTELDYYQFLVNYHHKQNTFNPRNLKIDYPLSEMKYTIKRQNLVGIDNCAFDNPNIGVVTATFEDYFLLQNFNDYSLSDSIQKIHFDDLIALELTSNTQVLLNNYLNL